MAEHNHFIIDKDTHFNIDQIERKIIPETPTKNKVVQFDHDSERFTFECPRYIEGHDMSQTTSVQVHYINIASLDRNQKERGVYEVEDLQVFEEDSDKVVFSWLISQNATKYAGSLHFTIRFSCTTDTGTLLYAWNTGIYTAIIVAESYDNGEPIIYEYTDVLMQWKQQLLEEWEEKTVIAEAAANRADERARDADESAREAETAANTAIEAVENAVRDIQEEGARVKASIPEDYTTLTEEVTGLKQDLSAMPGRNLLPYKYHQKDGDVVSGVTFNILEDGSIVANGTTSSSSGNFSFIHTDQNVTLPQGTYTLSGCSGGSSATYRLFAAVRYADGTQTTWSCYNSPVTMTTREEGVLRLSIAITGSGVVFENQKFYPMFELGSTAHSFEPPADSLRTVEQKVDMLEESVKTTEIVDNFSDMINTTAKSVLVLHNDNPGYGDGGTCWFETREGEIRGGITRADGSVVFAAAGQGAIVPANADRESLLSVANTYIDNTALVYGSSAAEEGTLFSESCLPNADGTYNISCSSFVDAVLSKITFNNSRYAIGADGKNIPENIPGQYLGNNYLPTTTAVAGAKPHSPNTRELAQFFAQQKRLYILPSDMTKAVDMLEFGDILFSNPNYSDDHFYHITHCAIVLGTFRAGVHNRIVVAHSTTSNSVTDGHIDFGGTGVKVSCIELLQNSTTERNYHVFARPDYGRMSISAVDAEAAGVGAGLPYKIRPMPLPGLSIDNNGATSLGAGAYAASAELIPVLPGTTLTYIGKTMSHNGQGIYVRAYWYDNLGQPLKNNIYKTLCNPTGNYPAIVPTGAAYARFRSGISASAGVRINWTDCTDCTLTVTHD